MLSLVERDTGVARGSLSTPPPRMPVFAARARGGPAAGRARELTDLRALLPLVQVQARERRMAVLDGERKTVVRLALEETTLVVADGAASPLRPSCGSPRSGATTRSGAPSSPRSSETSVSSPQTSRWWTRRSGCRADCPAVSPPRSGFRFAPTSARTARGGGRARLLGVIEANLEGTIEDLDSEFLHDLRVSVRRSRAVQRELRLVFPPAELERFRAEFRWLQQATGDARDLDVHVLDFEEMRALGWAGGDSRTTSSRCSACCARGGRRRTSRLVDDLRSERATRRCFRGGARSWTGCKDADERERPDAARPLAEVAGERIRKVYRQMVRMGDAIDDASPAEDYHELRKKGKELRYLLELFGASLFDAEVVKPMIRTLKGLQDVLGRHQDREVQVALLRSLAPEVAKADRGGEAALMSLGR